MSPPFVVSIIRSIIWKNSRIHRFGDLAALSTAKKLNSVVQPNDDTSSHFTGTYSPDGFHLCFAFSLLSVHLQVPYFVLPEELCVNSVSWRWITFHFYTFQVVIKAHTQAVCCFSVAVEPFVSGNVSLSRKTKWCTKARRFLFCCKPAVGSVREHNDPGNLMAFKGQHERTGNKQRRVSTTLFILYFSLWKGRIIRITSESF